MARSRRVARRAVLFGVPVTLAAAAVVDWFGRPWSALALTATATVGMINGLWLEGLLEGMLQPGRPRMSRPVVFALAARWVLWGLLFAVLVLLRERVELWAVAVGVACFLVAIGVAGTQTADRESREG